MEFEKEEGNPDNAIFKLTIEEVKSLHQEMETLTEIAKDRESMAFIIGDMLTTIETQQCLQCKQAITSAVGERLDALIQTQQVKNQEAFGADYAH